MQRISALFLLFIIGILTIAAQTGTIVGKIQTMDSTRSMSAVSVYLENTKIGTTTNSKGQYSIKNIPVGNYELVVSYIGYYALNKKIYLQEGQKINANFSMIESISTLSEVTIITGGSEGIKDIPGSVYYISPKDIEKYSYTDINRTLRAIPGVNLQEEDGFGLRPNIGLRGTGVERSSKITVMEDGILMAPAPYSAPAAYYFPTIGRMQGVEILKGSSQIKYGPYTTGGAINLISTQIPESAAGRVNLIGGSFGGRNLHAHVGSSEKNIGYLVETFQYGSNGFKKLDGGGNTGFDKQDYLAKLRVNTSKDKKIYQELLFKIGQTNETSNETYLGLTQEDFDSNPYRRYSASQKDQITTEQSQLSLTHTARLNKTISLNTTVYRTQFARNWYKLDKVVDTAGNKISISSILDDPSATPYAFSVIKGETSINEDVLQVKANNRSYSSKGAQTVLGYNFKTGQLNHTIDLGVRLHHDEVDRFQWVDEYAMENGVMQLTKSGTPGTESNRVESATALATYLQYKLKIGKFTATPGLRHESIELNRRDYGKTDPNRTGTDLKERSNHVNVVIPGIGIDYRFNYNISTFAGVHKGFAPPGSVDGALPEKSTNYEAGVRYTTNSLSGQAVLFYNDYQNLLGSDLSAAGGGGSGTLFNGGEVVAKGIEFQSTYNLLNSVDGATFSLPLSLVYTYTSAVFESSFESDFEGWGTVNEGDEFPYLAHNQFTFIVGLEHSKFSLNLSGRYTDEMRTAPGQGVISASEKTDSYLIIDASANYMAAKNIALFTNVTNLSNQVYVVARRPAGLRPGMPRAFNLGLKANF
jgi:Fe(3+) dicitrate transport protein